MFQTAHGCPIPVVKDDSSLPAGRAVELESGMARDAAIRSFDRANVTFLAPQRS